MAAVAAAVAAGVLVQSRGDRGERRGVVRACGGFDFPVGPPDGRGYYDAQPFGQDRHLGSDWNGVGGGNSDLGDPVHSIADGVVTAADDLGGGWGRVVRVVHRCGADRPEALYAHLDQVAVAPGQAVTRGQVLGTIGTAGGRYPAHLHLELRDRPGLPVGSGYGAATGGYLDPTRFIRDHR